MGYLKKWFASPIKFREGMTFFGSWRNQTAVVLERFFASSSCPPSGYAFAEVLQKFGTGITAMPDCLAGPKCETGSSLMALNSRLNSRRRFSNSPGEEQPSSRNWLARLWVEERRRVKVWNGGVKRQSASSAPDGATLLYTFASQLSFLKSFPSHLPFFKSIRDPDQDDQDSVINKTMHQPTISQYDGDFLPPNSPEEVSDNKKYTVFLPNIVGDNASPIIFLIGCFDVCCFKNQIDTHHSMEVYFPVLWFLWMIIIFVFLSNLR